jgi:hypothetical protein
MAESYCDCKACKKALFPRRPDQCHGAGKYGVPCRNKKQAKGPETLFCYLHEPPIVVNRPGGVTLTISRIRW